MYIYEHNCQNMQPLQKYSCGCKSKETEDPNVMHPQTFEKCSVYSFNHNYLVFYLQPGDDYEVIEGSQFVVSRTARKDNSSDYHVNGRKVPFKEVARLLKDCGIDLDHNRFLILQVGLTFKTNVHYVDPYLPFIRSCGVSWFVLLS